MKTRVIFYILGIASLNIDLKAQTAGADIAPPKQREAVVASAVAILAARSVPAVVPDSPPDPFQWPVDPSSMNVDDAPAEPVAPPAMGIDLLAKLAAQIPATGTVNLGGQPILLLGQKRLKVGDVVTISFDGQSYDLSIAAIAPTWFTVKRGELTHTRATRISSSTSRP